jgi:hypothetical protein
MSIRARCALPCVVVVDEGQVLFRFYQNASTFKIECCRAICIYNVLLKAFNSMATDSTSNFMNQYL